MQKSIDSAVAANPPFQKIEDAVKSTGLSAYFLRRGCRDGSVPCVRSGRTYFINVPGLLEQFGAERNADGKSARCDALL